MSHRTVQNGRLSSTLRIAAAVAVSVASAQLAHATDKTFVGPVGTPADFGTGSNWSPTGVPTSADAGFIAGGRIASSTYTGTVGPLSVGPNGNTGTGELRVTGGALDSSGLQIGHDAGTVAGTVTVSGGSLNLTGAAVLGEQGTGDNKLEATGGTLTLNNESYIGANGNGSLLVSGTGTVSVQRLNVGNSANSTGTIGVSGGTLNMTGKSYIGLRGSGVFNISGGVVNGADLGVGQEGDVPGVRGVINVTGGMSTFGQVVMGEISPNDNQLNVSAGTIRMNNEIYDGANGKATINLSGTGVISVENRIHLGASSGINGTTGVGSSGFLNITGGTLNATNADTGWILVGDGGTGVYTQSAGAVTVSRFAVGQNDLAVGTATQSGGTMRSRLTLVVGEVSPLNNVYNLSGGTAEIGTDGLDTEGNGIFIGSARGTGTVNISGTGAMSCHNPIIVGYGKFGTSDGTINISGGSLTTLNPGDDGNLRIGVYSGTTGRLNITGGTVSLAGALYNGVYDVPGGGGLGGTGIVTQSAGSLTAASTENEGSITQTGGTATLGAVTGGGTLSVGGSGTTTVTGLKQATLSLSGNGSLTIANATTPSASVVGSLSLAGTSKLDLTNNGLVVDYSGTTSPLTSIRSALAAGRITATLTPADARQAVAYAEASTLGITKFLDGDVDTSAVVLRSRLKGDTNFDGTVNFDDLLTLAKHYNLASGAVWTDGDFQYDGAVGFDDLLALAKNYSQSSTPAGGIESIGNAQFVGDFALAQSLVPEPAGLAALGLAGGAVLGRRRRAADRV